MAKGKRRSACVILAAGRSSRMGSPKALLPVGPTTLLGWQTSSSRNIDLTVVVMPGDKPYPLDDRTGLVAVQNYQQELGPFHSVRLGLAAVIEQIGIPDVTFITPVDCPAEQKTYEDMLKPELRSHFLVATNGGTRGHPLALSPQGVQLVLSAGVEENLRSLQNRDDISEIEVDSKLVCLNLNLPKDRAHLEALTSASTVGFGEC